MGGFKNGMPVLTNQPVTYDLCVGLPISLVDAFSVIVLLKVRLKLYSVPLVQEEQSEPERNHFSPLNVGCK